MTDIPQMKYGTLDPKMWAMACRIELQRASILEGRIVPVERVSLDALTVEELLKGWFTKAITQAYEEGAKTAPHMMAVAVAAHAFLDVWAKTASGREEATAQAEAETVAAEALRATFDAANLSWIDFAWDKSREQCFDCGAFIDGGHGHCTAADSSYSEDEG